MAELLVRLTDSPTIGDPMFDSKVSRRGDVIVAAPDGWAWGDQEIGNPLWAILKFPSLSLAMAESMTSPEFNTDPNNPSPTLQFRGFSFNLDDPNLPPEIASLCVDPIDNLVSIPISKVSIQSLSAEIIAEPGVSGVAISANGVTATVDMDDTVFASFKVQKPPISLAIGLSNSII